MIVGIDLGTTNSLVAYWKDGAAQRVTVKGTVPVVGLTLRMPYEFRLTGKPAPR